MKVPTRYTNSQDGETSPSLKSTRSVSGMKSLLPLQLSPPSIPTSKFSSLERLQRSKEDGARSVKEEGSPFSRRNSAGRTGRSNRGVPIFTPKNSPIFEQPYFSSTESILFSSLPSPSKPKPFIIKDFQLIDDAESRMRSRRSTMKIRPSRRSLSWENSSNDRRRDACDLDCLSQDPSDPETLVDNEAAWLRSPLNYWNDGRSECLPYIISQSMPVRRWLSDTASCMGEDDEGILACATALAPSKAYVVDVNKREPSGLSISIPPRSSSLGTTFPEFSLSEGRRSWMTFGACSSFYDDQYLSEEDGAELTSNSAAKSNPPRPNPKFMLDLSDPPLSPTSFSDDSFLQLDQTPPVAEQRRGTLIDATQKSNSLHEIISDLETHLTAFPSRMLLGDSNCVSSMRRYLQLPPRDFTIPRPQFDAPLSPTLSHDNVFLEAATEPEDNNFIPKVHCIGNPSTRRFGMPALQTFGPDLEPLNRIFPDTSNFMRSALYAHLLAYIFITSLTSSNLSTPTSHNSHAFRPPSMSIPSKAAELLGMTERERLNADIEIPSATKAIEDQLVKHISTLVKEMERSFDMTVGDEVQTRIERTVLISLVEVVRAIEKP